MAQRAVNDNWTVRGKPQFDYAALAELFMLSPRGRNTNYRRFSTAAEAIRFAMEELPASLLVGAVMEVEEVRFDHRALRELYSCDAYPLDRC